ncbi:MAG: DUF1223 domain-containing protein [Granulosicoccus sp.]
MLLVLLTLLLTNTAQASDSPRIVELFTSHGCSSCPAADELLARMIEDDAELIALEYHVDYWNGLVHGDDGSFTDPFSSAAFTARQRLYEQAGLQGRAGVYTPQAIINGQVAAVGSDKRAIQRALAQELSADLKIDIKASEGTLTVSVEGSTADQTAASGASVVLLRYQLQASTNITGGENRHRTLVNHNVVHSVETLGQLRADQSLMFEAAAAGSGDGCAVLIQGEALTPVLAVARCP